MTLAIRVAGVLIIPSNPARSTSSDGSSDSALTPDASSILGAQCTTDQHQFLVGLGELDADFADGHRITRPGERGRSLQHRLDGVESGPIQGEDGQPVLRDLEVRTRRPHPVSQIRHLGHGQTLILGDHKPLTSRRRRRRAMRRTLASPYGPNPVSFSGPKVAMPLQDRVSLRAE